MDIKLNDVAAKPAVADDTQTNDTLADQLDTINEDPNKTLIDNGQEASELAMLEEILEGADNDVDDDDEQDDAADAGYAEPV